ncbi:acetoin utilization protein AcuC [Aquicoccus sp. SCR17]|nr:acetoin utilization protein AcuC [Carideicomes alvinocaridis]
MQAPVFIGSNIYRGSRYGPHHPLAIQRVPVVIDLCRAMGWLPSDQYRVSPRAKPAALQAFHAPDYIDALQAAEAAQGVDAETRDRYGLGTLSNPVYGEMFRRPATAAGGSVLGAELLASGVGRVFNPGGGTHHGMPGRASGFCYFNDPVLAMLTLRARGLERIAYVDIDAHHCDGVEAAFSGTEGMLLISTHEERRWPFTGALEDRAGGVALNLPLPRATGDGAFRLALHEVILPAIQRHRPQTIVLQCGADALLEDPLARLAASNRMHLEVLEALMELQVPMLVLGGGGYTPWTVGRLWSSVWARLNGHELPERLPEPGQDLLRALDSPRRWRPGETLLTTLLDDPREGEIADEHRSRVRALRDRLKAEV